jgi:hypothetical protein
MRSSPLWKKLIWTVMFLVVLEGVFRKWVFPQFQAELFFLKDLLLIVAYLGFLSAHVRPGAHRRIMVPLKVMAVFSLAYFTLELVNPNSPSFFVSLLGLKNYLLYMPLAFIVPYMFTSSEDLERKLRLYAFVMIPFAALGLVQFLFPPDHWINGYLSHASENLRMGALFGASKEHVRSTGTFSYIGGYAAFLTVMGYLAAALAARNRWRISGSLWRLSSNLWPLSLLAVTVAAMFTTGSRLPIWMLIATWPLVTIVWGYGGLVSMGDVTKMVFVAAMVTILAVFLAADAYDAYAYRVEHAGDTSARILSPLTQAYDAMQIKEPFGVGMGTTNGGALAIMKTDDFWWLNGNTFEIETGRVIQETGLIGFILIYAVRVWLLVKAITLGVRFRTPLHIALSGVLVALFFQDLIGFVINNATVGIYHWFSAGLLFAMYRLEAAKVVVGQSTRDLPQYKAVTALTAGTRR